MLGDRVWEGVIDKRDGAGTPCMSVCTQGIWVTRDVGVHFQQKLNQVGGTPTF